MRLRSMACALTMGGAFVAMASEAKAADPWIERPLALPTLHAEIQAGVGFGQYTAIDGQKIGGGSNLEAAIGLPFFGELSVRTGLRFGDGGKAAQADYYARLFDHETPVASSGNDAWANPEIRLRGTLVDVKVFAIGLETRLVVPVADNSNFAIAPGVPMMIRIPKLMRIDTGVFIPITDADAGTLYTISIPAQLWFQVNDFFFGPMTGVRYNHFTSTSIGVSGVNTTTVSATRTDIPAGLGFGYTVGGMLDLKAQLYMLRINDSDWSKTLGGGLGVGLLIP